MALDEASHLPDRGGSGEPLRLRRVRSDGPRRRGGEADLLHEVITKQGQDAKQTNVTLEQVELKS